MVTPQAVTPKAGEPGIRPKLVRRSKIATARKFLTCPVAVTILAGIKN